MTATATLLKMPDPTARTERQLRAAWAECDRLEAKLREAKAHARKLEQQVGEARGYGRFIRREALERAMGGRDG